LKFKNRIFTINEAISRLKTNMMRNKFLVLLLLLTIAFIDLSAQKLLIIDKPNSYNRLRFRENEAIHLKSVSNQLDYNGILVKILDSTIIVNETEILLDDIEIVYKHRHFFERAAIYSMIAGAGYTSLDMVNNLINNQQIVKLESVITGGSLLGIGMICQKLSLKKYKIYKAWRARIIEF